MTQEIAIVGAGIAGLSLAWALHKRGATVSLYDQGPIPNPVSSSFDEHRITRHTYGGLSGYGALMPHAFKVYDELWTDLGETHYLPTKLVYFGRQSSSFATTTASELDGMGIAHRPLTLVEIAERFPMIRTEGIVDSFEADGAGMLFASRIVTALARWLRDAGVSLHPGVQISDLDAESGRFRANDVPTHADKVVVAAGAWLPLLLPDTAPRLTPSRQVMLYLQPPDHLVAAWANSPVLVDTGITHGGYVLPPRGGTRLKIGDHHFSRRGIGTDDRIATELDTEGVFTAASEIFTDFEQYTVLERKICYYTVSDDERFVVEPIGASGWLLSACSGHGFKLGPLIASGLADALVGRRNAAEIPAWAAGKPAP